MLIRGEFGDMGWDGYKAVAKMAGTIKQVGSPGRRIIKQPNEVYQGGSDPNRDHTSRTIQAAKNLLVGVKLR